MTTPLLEMDAMSVELPIGLKVADIVSDITLTLNRGERLGVVGESGSGKSITALAAMGLLPDRMRVRGRLRFDGEDLANKPEAELCKMRGSAHCDDLSGADDGAQSGQVHRRSDRRRPPPASSAKAAPMRSVKRAGCLIVSACLRRASISIFIRTSFPAGSASA
jgi:energy-coupling factor transporter ATP-binding protein EcfA2